MTTRYNKIVDSWNILMT